MPRSDCRPLVPRRLLTLAVALTCLCANGCGKPQVETTLVDDALPGAAEAPQAYVVARLDATVLAEPDVEAEPVGSVLEGDLLTVLAERGEFSKVNVRATGTTGWIYSNLCLHIPPSPYWEGDTNKARETARRIYQDKFLVERDAEGRLRFPVAKVKVEAAFNTLTFFAAEGDPRPVLARTDAEALARHYLARLGEIFPSWKEPTVYVRGYDGQTEYMLSLGRDGKPHFL